MLKSRIMKATTLGVCMSMIMSVPVFASNGQGNQTNVNTMPFMQNGIQSITQGAIQMPAGTPGAIQGGQMQNNQTQNQQLSNAAQYMVNQGIIKGSSNGNYSMSDNVKRGDMSIMLMRAFNFNTSSTSDAGNFSDVSSGSYYYEAVNTMRTIGIAQGDGQNFRPGSYMTLEEAILFVERALDAAGIDYDDTDLTSLFEGRSLSENATREDVATILYAVLGDDAEAILSGEADADAIAYDADENTAITFDEDDFSDACADATEGTLDYVVFANPSTSLGKLYYGYDSSSDYDGKVSTSDEIYLAADTDDDEIDLSDLSFVPNEDAHGTVVISYTGYDTDDSSFKGTVKITIDQDEAAVADTITYTTDEDTDLTFDEDDFNDASNDATGEDLSYIRFNLPASTYGKLYYNYESSDDYEDKVAATDKYYYGSDGDDELALSEITFVPDDDFTGTAKIYYTGVNEDGDTFTGTVKVTVE